MSILRMAPARLFSAKSISNLAIQVQGSDPPYISASYQSGTQEFRCLFEATPGTLSQLLSAHAENLSAEDLKKLQQLATVLPRQTLEHLMTRAALSTRQRDAVAVLLSLAPQSRKIKSA